MLPFAVRFELIKWHTKFQALPFSRRAAVVTPILALWWLVLPIIGTAALVLWTWLVFTKRWFGLANIVLFCFMAGSVFPYRAEQPHPMSQFVVLYVFAAFLVWLVYFHSVRFKRLRFKGQDVVIRIGSLRLPVFRPVAGLRPFWKRKKSSKGSAQDLKSQLFAFFVRMNYYGVQNPAPHISVTEMAAGIYQADFNGIPEGWTDEQFVKIVAPELAAHLGLLRVTERDLDPRSGHVTLRLMSVNPLEKKFSEFETPLLHLSEGDLKNPYLPLAVGVDSDGEFVTRQLFSQNYGSSRNLTAGESGTGKSSVQNQTLAFATACPYINVVVIDGKGSEYNEYENYVENYTSFTRDGLKGFWAALKFVEDEVTRRGTELGDNKARQAERFSDIWNHIDDGDFLYWVWDELGGVLAHLDKKEFTEVQNRIFGITSKARTLGIAVDFSSQSFRSDILDTRIRDNTFNVSIGYKLGSLQEASYLGFDSSDLISPHLIRGEFDAITGDFSAAGVFAIKERTIREGRSYFMSRLTIRDFLQSHGDSQAVIEKNLDWDKDFEKNLLGN